MREWFSGTSRARAAALKSVRHGTKVASFIAGFDGKMGQKILIFKNESGMLLKTRTCGKNEPENEAGHVVENKQQLKTGGKQNGAILKVLPGRPEQLRYAPNCPQVRYAMQFCQHPSPCLLVGLI
jgi:hypothetical protein